MKSLLVLIRGWTDSKDFFNKNTGGEFPQEFISKLEASCQTFDIKTPELPMSMFSTASPEQIVQLVIDCIDGYTNQYDYEKIILLGYSSGGPIARAVYCSAWGASEKGEIHLDNRKPWAPLLTRLVFLSGITRGWEISSATPHLHRFFAPILTQAARVISFIKGGKPFILRLRRGSPFIITTKLNYLLLTKKLGQLEDQGNYKIAESVYLLGTQDEFISPTDCVDLGIRPEILYIEIPRSNHLDVLRIHEDTNEAEFRTRILKRSINENFTELKNSAIKDEDIDDYLDELDRPIDIERRSFHQDIGHAVIVMHGIRDNGFWTKRISRSVKENGNTIPILVRAPTPSYGYFSLMDFANTLEREKATRWFLEIYSEVKTYFPNAEISFVGHSNGTYLACNALEKCESIKFKNMVLAGCVVRTDFSWDKYIGRVDNVLNYVASNDLVVALLPAAFEKLKLNFFNVGGAGFYGFSNCAKNSSVQSSTKEVSDLNVCNLTLSSSQTPPNILNYRFVKGGHGAAIKESFWGQISDFILNINWPEPPTKSSKFVKTKRSKKEKVVEKINHIIFAAGIVSLVLIVALIQPFSSVASLIILICLLIFIWSFLHFY